MPIKIPSDLPARTALEKENIFLVPLGKGIRLAVCSVSKKKIHGLAAKIKSTLDAVGAKQ